MASSSAAWGKESWIAREARLEADRKVLADEWASMNQNWSWRDYFLSKVMSIYKTWNLGSYHAIQQNYAELREQLEG